MMEIRSTAPNPHNGIDLNRAWVTVYPVLDGKVVSPLGGTYGMVTLAHDRNGDGTADFYSRYVHMKDIKVTLGQQVTKSTPLGTAADAGCPGAPHLDFSLFVKDSSGYNRFMPGKYFYPNLSGSQWNYGYDLDFAQPATGKYDSQYGTSVEINIYPKGTSDSSTIIPTLYYRVKGTSTWTSKSMSKISGTTVYRYYFDPSLDGKVLQYYVKIERSGCSGYVTRPMEKGLEAPGGCGAPSVFYEVTVKKGSAQSPSLESLE